MARGGLVWIRPMEAERTTAEGMVSLFQRFEIGILKFKLVSFSLRFAK